MEFEFCENKNCRAPFVPKRKGQRFCCERCRQAAYYQRRLETYGDTAIKRCRTCGCKIHRTLRQNASSWARQMNCKACVERKKAGVAFHKPRMPKYGYWQCFEMGNRARSTGEI